MKVSVHDYHYGKAMAVHGHLIEEIGYEFVGNHGNNHCCEQVMGGHCHCSGVVRVERIHYHKTEILDSVVAHWKLSWNCSADFGLVECQLCVDQLAFAG